MHTKFPKKLTCLPPWCANVRARIKGVRNVSFSENFAHVLNGWFLNVTAIHKQYQNYENKVILKN